MVWKVSSFGLLVICLGLAGALLLHVRSAAAEASRAAHEFQSLSARATQAAAENAACEKDRAERESAEQAQRDKMAKDTACVVATKDHWKAADAIGFTKQGQALEFWNAVKRDETTDVLNLIIRKNRGFVVERGTKCSFVGKHGEVAQVRIVEGSRVGNLVWLPDPWRVAD